MSTPASPSSPVSPRRSFESRTTTLAAATAGLLAAGASVGVGHLVAALTVPAASPVLAVGSSVIDLAPQPLKAFAIATFGESDKIALLAGIGSVLLVVALGIGVLARSRLWLGVAAVVGFGLVGAAAALSRPVATPSHALPAALGAVAGAVVLVALIRALGSPARGVVANRSRRGFLVGAAGVAILSASAGGLGAVLSSARGAALRRVALPTPSDPAPSLPAGADLGIPGIAPFYTPNASFYRVDTALDVPIIDPATWSLRIHGMVEREVRLSFDELLQLPAIERDITMTCVSNQVGGGYVGTARWVGIPLATVLELAGVKAGADQIVSRSIEGMTIGTPTAVALDGRDAMLAIGMNGQPLPAVNGFPVRLLVPGLYGYVSATKWLVEIELTTFDAYDPYWVQRGWAAEAPIKTMARIDTPKPLSTVPAGRVMVGGVAWAQRRGIDRVEVRFDDGEWSTATLSTVASVDTWRQWTFEWTPTPGRHRIEVRATDGAGVIQTESRAEPFPDGATGWHSILVSVA